MPKFTFQKRSGALYPADSAALEWLQKMAQADYVMVERPRKPRNIQHHRKMFALLNLVCENIDYPKDPHTLLKYIQVRIGAHCDVIKSAKAGEVKLPKSIAFESMSQDEFDPLYKAIVDFIVSEVLPGVGKEALEQEVLAMVA